MEFSEMLRFSGCFWTKYTGNERFRNCFNDPEILRTKYWVWNTLWLNQKLEIWTKNRKSGPKIKKLRVLLSRARGRPLRWLLGPKTLKFWDFCCFSQIWGLVVYYVYTRGGTRFPHEKMRKIKICDFDRLCFVVHGIVLSCCAIWESVGAVERL